MYITDLSEEDIEIAIKVTMTMVVRHDMMRKAVKDNCEIVEKFSCRNVSIATTIS